MKYKISVAFLSSGNSDASEAAEHKHNTTEYETGENGGRFKKERLCTKPWSLGIGEWQGGLQGETDSWIEL